ncbi:MAG: hypothetical protein OEZ68_03050 [Gammaproteobacteria bacterium]|nr:hypothetical protein [Gammaproteobacteria bacterium]MDH5799760.1 hypothetical protein [Gammaproteobacteria bacterium]
MALRIIINDKECTSPMVKYGLAVAVLVGTIAISALIVFVFLPIIGVSIAATMGLVIIIGAGIFAAAVALTLGTVLLSTFFVLMEMIVGKIRRH